MEKKIVLKDKTIRRKIAEMVGVTPEAVTMALSYKRNSPNAIKIREMALQMGGIPMEELWRTKREVKVLDVKGNIVKTIK